MHEDDVIALHLAHDALGDLRGVRVLPVLGVQGPQHGGEPGGPTDGAVDGAVGRTEEGGGLPGRVLDRGARAVQLVGDLPGSELGEIGVAPGVVAHLVAGACLGADEVGVGGDVLADREEGGPGVVLREVRQQGRRLRDGGAVVEGQGDALHLLAVGVVVAGRRVGRHGGSGGGGRSEIEGAGGAYGLLLDALAEAGQPGGDRRPGERHHIGAGGGGADLAPVEGHPQAPVSGEGDVVQGVGEVRPVGERLVDLVGVGAVPSLELIPEGGEKGVTRLVVDERERGPVRAGLSVVPVRAHAHAAPRRGVVLAGEPDAEDVPGGDQELVADVEFAGLARPAAVVTCRAEGGQALLHVLLHRGRHRLGARHVRVAGREGAGGVLAAVVDDLKTLDLRGVDGSYRRGAGGRTGPPPVGRRVRRPGGSGRAGCRQGERTEQQEGGEQEACTHGTRTWARGLTGFRSCRSEAFFSDRRGHSEQKRVPCVCASTDARVPCACPSPDAPPVSVPWGTPAGTARRGRRSATALW